MSSRAQQPLPTAFLSLLAALVLAGHVAGQQPSNVLFIAIDDLKPIGSMYSEEPGNFLQYVYPDKQLRQEIGRRMTPNLQRLADRSVNFTSAYCAAPACNPSRAALMTGIRPHVSGLTTNERGIFFRKWEYRGEKPLAEAVTLPELLKQHGWYTASTGKIFHSNTAFAASDGNRSWTSWTNVKGDAGKRVRGRFSSEGLDWGQEGGDDANYTDLNDIRKARFIAQVLRDGRATNGEHTFALPSDKPFFLACGIFRPHLPFYATKDLLDLFPTDEMHITRDLLEQFMADAGDLPKQAYRWCGLAVDANGEPQLGSDRFVRILKLGSKNQPVDGDLLGWKRMLQHYFASCAIADRSVGLLLDALEASQYADNTMIILWSDHGYHLGEKLHETKFTLWDDGARVNFMIADPRHPEGAGHRCERPVTLTDIYPTVAAMAGLELPDQRIRGTNLEPLLADPTRPWATPAQSTYQGVDNNMLRTDRYKLIRYENDDKSVELYDMREDPEEFVNLAGSQSVKAIEAELTKKLDQVLER